jgi:hypothetical protein
MKSRREFLGCCAASGVALHAALLRAAERHGAAALAPRGGHHPARAKQLLFIFLTGGFSHLDTFDPKPKLAKDAGKTVAAPDLRGMGKEALLGSPFKFTPCGRSGLMISELFPHLGTVADELCVVRSLHTDIVEHFQATLAMHTGSATVPMPSLGAWLSMGLGTFNANLPAYVVLCEHLPYAGAQVWDHGFLPPLYQGVRVIPGPEPIPDLKPTAKSVTLHELEQMMLRDVNERHAKDRGGDPELRARINSFDTAAGMMREAPEVFDVSRESKSTLAEYEVPPGDSKSFAWQCLIARRLLERGVRVVELIDTGAHDNWDAHGNMQEHRPKAKRVDQPVAALIRDLKRRGMLEQTLVVICTEFGRTPWVNNTGGKGRNHYAKAFSSLLAGAGVRGGITYGETDEYGAAIVADPCHVHDYHATILHLMGFNHEKLTYRYAGRDFRLTDVAGKVITKVLA